MSAYEPFAMHDPPTDGELRLLIRQHPSEYLPAYKRELANDAEYVDLRVRATQTLAESLIRSGLRSYQAWDQAIREAALAL